MGWEDTCTSGATANISLTTIRYLYDSTSTTTDTSWGAVSIFDYGGTSTAWGRATISNVGWSYGSISGGWGGGYTTVRGFTQAQINEVRSDFDAVKANWKRRRAEVKARKLFRRVVGDVLYHRFRKQGYHEVRGKSGTRYRLSPGQWVKVMEEHERSSEKIKHLLCAHLPFGVPWFDTMVIQHLMLTSSKETEERFLKIANVHEVAGPYPVEELRVRQAEEAA